MNSPTPAPAKAPIGSLRALWPFVRRHRGLFIAWLLALAVSSSASLSLPVAFRTMIDDGFSSGSAGSIDRAFMLLFVVALLLAVGTAARFFFVSLLGERVVADLRTELYAHLISLDAGFYDRTRSGELVSRLTSDVELIRSIIGSVMSIALRSGITAIGAMVMLFVTSPKLAAWALVGIPVAVLPVIIRRAPDPQDLAQQPGPHRRCQCPGHGNARRGAHRAGACTRGLRARPLHRCRRHRRRHRTQADRRAGADDRHHDHACSSARSRWCCGRARTT